MRHRLLRDAEDFGELHLGDALGLAAFGDPAAESAVIGKGYLLLELQERLLVGVSRSC
jgi:hypothetical protein